MRTASLPAVPVEPETRAATEAVLREGESLEAFVEAAVQREVERRVRQQAFVAEARESLAEHDVDGGLTMEEMKARIQERTRRHSESLRALLDSRQRAA